MAARAMCQDSVRQYDSPSLFEERRISSFRSSIVSLHGTALCSRARDLFSSSSTERKVEWFSRSSIQEQADQHRVNLRLDPHSFRRYCLRLGETQIDLFATIENTKLPLFISPCPDEGAEACDALNQDWNRWSPVYLFPPVQLLGEFPDPLGKFTEKGFLIAPFWPTAIWFLELEKRCLSRFLLPKDHFLFQVKEGVTFYHRYHSIFRLHVSRVAEWTTSSLRMVRPTNVAAWRGRGFVPSSGRHFVS